MEILTSEERTRQTRLREAHRRSLGWALQRRQDNGGREDSPGEIDELRGAIEYLSASLRG